MKSPCRAGASCQNTNGGYRCHCQAGYTGRNCETDIDDCRPSEWLAGPARSRRPDPCPQAGAGQGTCPGHVRGWAGQYPGAGLAPAALSIQRDLSEGRLVGGWRKCWGGARWLLVTSEVVAGGSGAVVPG